MTVASNAHTHTEFGDGKSTVAEMARAAASLGFVSLGFSDHGTQGFDLEYSVRDEPAYIAEVCRLRTEYEGRMKIWLGVEFDPYGMVDARKYDYTIGAVHNIRYAGRQCPVDATAQPLDELLRDHLGGDGMMLARLYYDAVAVGMRLLRPTILGHFDLIRKNNRGNRYFDTSDPMYRKIALNALEKARDCVTCMEVNTGGMARGYTDTPYPEAFLLSAWREMGGEVIVTSDCHRAKFIDFGFDEAIALLRETRFRSVLRLGRGEALFEEVAID